MIVGRPSVLRHHHHHRRCHPPQSAGPLLPPFVPLADPTDPARQRPPTPSRRWRVPRDSINARPSIEVAVVGWDVIVERRRVHLRHPRQYRRPMASPWSFLSAEKETSMLPSSLRPLPPHPPRVLVLFEAVAVAVASRPLAPSSSPPPRLRPMPTVVPVVGVPTDGFPVPSISEADVVPAVTHAPPAIANSPPLATVFLTVITWGRFHLRITLLHTPTLCPP